GGAHGYQAPSVAPGTSADARGGRRSRECRGLGPVAGRARPAGAISAGRRAYRAGDRLPARRVARDCRSARADVGDPGVDGGPARDLDYAAAFLGLSKHTVRALTRRRRLAHFRLGRRLVFRDADLEDYMRRHRVEVATR